MHRLPSIAVVGATGAVGREFLDILAQRGFAHGEIRLLASARSARTRVPYRGGEQIVHELREDSFAGIDIAFFSAGSGVSKALAPRAVEAGAVVIDNSSAFRLSPGVPLVVPEVNPQAMTPMRAAEGNQPPVGAGLRPGIIANPNCSTIILLMAATPLRRAFGVRRMVVATYQAVSGAGARAMEELRAQASDVLSGRPPRMEVFHEPCAFNVFSHNSAVDPATGRNQEEEKMVLETRKIWDDPAVGIAATCVRVPVFRAHAEAVNVTLDRPATLAQVRRVLEQAPGVRLIDDRTRNRFPTPIKAAGGDETLVGRLRGDPSQPSESAASGDPADRRWQGIEMFIASDQLRKGAALNAVQIAETLLRPAAATPDGGPT